MTEDKILLVTRYMENDMDEAEMADFKLRLADDVMLQEHLRTYESVHQNLKMKLANHDDIKQTLVGFNKQYFSAEPKVVSLKPAIKWLSGIAAILVIGLMIWAPWNANLYETYVDDSQLLVTERGAESITELDKAAAFYNEKNYEAASASLEKLHAQQPSDAMIGYYYGLALLKTNKVEKARTLLQPIYNGESVFKYEAAYSIALSYLKEDKKEECKNWLQKIPAETTRYQQAEELLEKLK
jgi:tetratricopeptide (TPR) repeat protein